MSAIGMTMAIQRTTTTRMKARGAQSGAVTHHQDQSMTSVSFRTKKVMNSRTGSPGPT
jgi:hypothetical protein